MKFLTAFTISFFCLNLAGVYAQTSDLVDANRFEELIQSMPGAQIVDVRTPAEFGKGYIGNAMNMDVNADTFAEYVATLDKKRPVLVYCYSGGRSVKAVDYLKKQGFSAVYELKGGFMHWNKAKKPVSSAEKKGPGMSSAEFEKMVSAERVVLIDFYAKWCGPCRKMAPDLEAIATERSRELTVLKLDADQNSALADELNVDALPGIFLYKNGEKVWSHSGYISKAELDKVIDGYLQ